MTIFECIPCNFTNSKKSTYTDHTHSTKHKKNCTECLENTVVVSPNEVNTLKMRVLELEMIIKMRDEQLKMKDELLKMKDETIEVLKARPAQTLQTLVANDKADKHQTATEYLQTCQLKLALQMVMLTKWTRILAYSLATKKNIYFGMYAFTMHSTHLHRITLTLFAS